MTDAEKIEIQATIDARDDFEAINEWLEKKKKQVEEFRIKNPDKLMAALALFSSGVYLGSRTKGIFRILSSALSLAACAYSGYEMFNYRQQAKKQETSEKTEEIPKTTDTKMKTALPAIVPDDEADKHLKNVKIIEPAK